MIVFHPVKKQALIVSYSLGVGAIPWLIMSEVCVIYFIFFLMSVMEKLSLFLGMRQVS